VEEGYGRWAATYDQDPNPLLAREERHLLPLIAGSPGKQVLDIACGTGRWLKRLSERGGSFGLDSSSAMLQIARDKSAWPNRLARGNCEQLPFRDRAFDLAVCSFALAHLSDLKSTAEELARVLQPGSNLFVSDLHPEAIAHGWRVGFRDGSALLEIDASVHAADNVIQSFRHEGFSCVTEEPLWLGEPEKTIFERSGKSSYFREACEIPAVIVFHFRRTGSSFNRSFS
jgi:ubiquinone/menaquinone biosynthesis C-methylase UbiE